MDIRCVEEIGTELAKGTGVGSLVPRVGTKILTFTELFRVYEQCNAGARVRLQRGLDQGKGVYPIIQNLYQSQDRPFGR